MHYSIVISIYIFIYIFLPPPPTKKKTQLVSPMNSCNIYRTLREEALGTQPQEGDSRAPPRCQGSREMTWHPAGQGQQFSLTPTITATTLKTCKIGVALSGIFFTSDMYCKIVFLLLCLLITQGPECLFYQFLSFFFFFFCVCVCVWCCCSGQPRCQTRYHHSKDNTF